MLDATTTDAARVVRGGAAGTGLLVGTTGGPPGPIEALDLEIAEKRAERRRLKLLEEQRQKLLPRLQRLWASLQRKRAPVQLAMNRVEEAIQQIKNGELTEFRLRKAPQRKAKAPAPVPEHADTPSTHVMGD